MPPRRLPRVARRLAAAAVGLAASATPILAQSPSIALDPAVSPPEMAATAIPDGQIERAVAALDGMARQVMETSGLPGLAVAVSAHGRTVYARGFGVRRVGEPAAVDGDTVFQVASLSKSITGTIIARQVGRGIVAWDTPVARHLPWFALSDPWVTARVTVGDLMAHRSGLADHAGDDLEELGFDRRTVLERLRFHPLAPFRTSHFYTNMGPTLAAEAVAAASGTDWESLADEALFRPLGMTTASMRFADFQARPNRAPGHMKIDGRFQPLRQRMPDVQAAAGGVSASANDMARWMAMVLDNGRFDGRTVVEPAALLPAVTAQMVPGQTHAATARPGLAGFGFNVGSGASGRTTLSHSGAFYLGTGTTYIMIPSARTGIVVLSNGSPTGAVEGLAMSFAELVQYGQVTRDWQDAYGRMMAPMLAPVGELAGKAPPTAPRPAQPLAAYAGRYASDYFGPLTIDARDAALTLTIGPAAATYRLRHWDGDRFVFPLLNENAPEGTRSIVDFGRGPAGAMETAVVEFWNASGLGTFRRTP
ncbi:serine hydrolase [Allostella vacuolata]|nr:serine hydrolase [Stella vacuolata]